MSQNISLSQSQQMNSSSYDLNTTKDEDDEGSIIEEEDQINEEMEKELKQCIGKAVYITIKNKYDPALCLAIIEVTNEDNVEYKSFESELPKIYDSDDGKVLTASGGEWKARPLPTE